LPRQTFLGQKKKVSRLLLVSPKEINADSDIKVWKPTIANYEQQQAIGFG